MNLDARRGNTTGRNTCRFSDSVWARRTSQAQLSGYGVQTTEPEDV